MAGIDSFLLEMEPLHASDLHLTSGSAPRYRIHGEMKIPDGMAPLSSDDILKLVFEIAPERSAEQFKAEGDADFAYEIPGSGRYRVNLFKDRFGPGAVFRIIPTEIPSAEKLGLPAAVRRFSMLSKGLVLVTGPTGSGKSTTLAAIVDEINRTRDEHIITIEDPIEFVHDPKRCLVNQREVHRDTESFARALRAALREDPDIVLVGEMRDLETIEIALETAETGHLVFGTLHTNGAAATVDRIIDKFPSDRQNQIRTLLGDTLKGVIAQTLCRKNGGGRVAAFEILVVNNPVAAHIREGKTFLIPSVMQTSKGLGMQTFADDLVKLVLEGKISCMEAYVKAADKDSIRVAMQNAGLPLDFLKDEEGEAEDPVAKAKAEIAALKAKLASAPRDIETMLSLSEALSEVPEAAGRDGREAQRIAENAVRVGATGSRVIVALGMACAAQGNRAAAIDYLNRALAEAKRTGDEGSMGRIYAKLHLLKAR